MFQNYTTENLVIGESNKVAYNAIESTMCNLGTQNNPLTLYGSSGSGKTHLAHAWLKKVHHEGKTTIQMSAMEFFDRLIFALSNQTEDEFRNDLIECDLLTIDDLQHFVGRFGCQDELCIILDERIATGKQVIFTSIEHPTRLEWHSNQLESRLLSGLNIKLDLANTTMQIQILKQRLEDDEIALSHDIIAEAVKSTNGNGWFIEGVAKQLVDMSKQGIELTRDTVTKLLQP